MFKICLIFIFGVFSCREATVKKVYVRELILDTLRTQIDSSIEKSGHFHWKKWKKPNPKYVYLSDDILKHLAKGHVKIDGSYGDIDENGVLDLIIITGLANEDSLRLTGKAQPRHMLVFLDQKDFTFQNIKAIPSISCDKQTDPYSGHLAITAKFVIRESCIKDKTYRSEYRFAFVPSLNDWLLDTIITESSALSDEKYTLDTMTKESFGKLSLRTFDISKIKTRYR